MHPIFVVVFLGEVGVGDVVLFYFILV